MFLAERDTAPLLGVNPKLSVFLVSFLILLFVLCFFIFEDDDAFGRTGVEAIQLPCSPVGSKP